jgi:hypothetical protein
LPGWRWESALGIEVEVPADWAINDIDCNMTDAPTVAHPRRGGRSCFTPEPPSKQVIEFISYDGRAVPEPAAPEGLVVAPVVLGTDKAERAEGRATDGRFLGWLRVPRLQAALSVRVRDRATVERVLASARIVDVAHDGCATSRAAMRPAPPARSQGLVPEDTSSLVLCSYGDSDVLRASVRLEGEAASRHAATLNGAWRRPNADVPAHECLRPPQPPEPDLVLIARSAADSATVQLRFSGCTDRGFYNGRDHAHITQSVLLELMRPLKNSFMFGALPP